MSYGSNLSADRFRTYLQGGLPEGRVTSHVGARDRSLWRDDQPVTLPHQLFFGGHSKGWGGGGVAFVDVAQSVHSTLGRAYLVTAEQFQDVLAQESGRVVGSEVDLSGALDEGKALLGAGSYDMVMHLGDSRGWPMLTFTRPEPNGHPRNAPSAAYAATIVQGLIESHAMEESEAHTYVARWTDDQPG